MAIIDLETGRIVREPEQQPQPAQPQPISPEPVQGRIIDLETGNFIEPAPVQQTVQQPVQQPAQPQIDPNILAQSPRFQEQQQAERERREVPGAGVFEPVAALATGAIAEPVAGLTGLAAAPVVGAERAAGIVEDVRGAITQEPTTPSGQENIAAIGQVLAPVAEALESAESTLGDLGFEVGGPLGGAIGRTIPSAILEGLGLAGFRRSARRTPESIQEQTLDLAEAESVRRAREASEATGVGLFKAQQTLNPTDIERQAFVNQLPSGANNARRALLEQNQQAANAVDEFLGSLAPPESISGAASRFRDASQKSIEAQKNIRRQQASPLFNQAFQEGADVDLAPVRGFIDAELAELPETGEMFKSIKKAQTLLRGKKRVIDGQEVETPPSLRQLHNAKLEIDQMLNKFGADSLGNTTKAKLAELKDTLLTQIDEASPSYREARQEFARLSPDVDKLNDSIIGAISGLDDVQLKNVAQRVFDPSETNPQVLRQAKATIEAVDPDAWNVLLRSELERRMGRVRADISDLGTTAALENIPSQLFNSIFGNKKSRDVLFNAVDGEQKRNLKYLETALRRATKGRPGGSQTAIREEIKQELRGGVAQTIRDFFSSPIRTTTQVGEEAAFNARVKAMSNALFDPNWSEEMARIRELPQASTQAQKRMENLLNSALITLPTIDREEQEQQ